MESSKLVRFECAEQEGEDVTASGVLPAESSSSSNLSSQRNSKKAAKRSSDGGDLGSDPVQKRRRRAFSCLSCQKLKCRCEYEAGATGCHRCQTLRTQCSLRLDQIASRRTSSSNLNVEQPGLTVEERLQRHEDSLQEIKNMIKDLSSQGNSSDNESKSLRNLSTRGERDTPGLVDNHPSPEYFSNPADKGTNTAPVVVLREINEQAHRGYRQLLGHVNLDLVQLQLLDEQTAAELIQLFIRHQDHMLLVCNTEELNQSSEARKVSAFLYSVCCLIGIVYREDICGTPVHRQIYEQVRITLGQAMLASPLNLDDINAMLIMSNNASAPSRDGVEYIDSWLLSGYCAQQAMLSIGFSKIVDNIKRGHSTVDDYRAMHLWTTACLHHLRWAATTGRPSIIPNSYINQCNILLSFYRSTMQDGMLVAEIMLYSVLHQKLARHSYLHDSEECEEFLLWKQKWNYLLALPTSSMLKVGYHAAYLILATRSLEDTGHGLGSKTFLSSKTTGDYDNDEHQWTETREDNLKSKDRDRRRAIACNHAMLVLQTFLDMPLFLMDAIPTCFCLCIGYCALVLAHLEDSQSQVPAQVSLDLVIRLDQWIKQSPGKAWSFKYCKLAREKIESRTSAATLRRTAHPSRDSIQKGAGGSNPSSRGGSQGPHDHPTVYTTESLPMASMQPIDPDTIYPRFGLNGQLAFPSMEDFFGGGFLEFMK